MNTNHKNRWADDLRIVKLHEPTGLLLAVTWRDLPFGPAFHNGPLGKTEAAELLEAAAELLDIVQAAAGASAEEVDAYQEEILEILADRRRRRRAP